MFTNRRLTSIYNLPDSGRTSTFSAEQISKGGPSHLNTIDLAGVWSFRLDPEDQGLLSKWFLSMMPDEIKLPGSTDIQGFGEKATIGETSRLTREYSYVGPAWYRREIVIPDNWKGKRITLFLERCHWETMVWVDGEHVGMRNSLSVPHVYDLTNLLNPGLHTLVIRVDNRLKINVGHTYGSLSNCASSITDESQTNWNGIIGRIFLDAHDFVGIDSIQIYPDMKQDKLNIKVILYNMSTDTATGSLSLATNPDCGSLSDYNVEITTGQSKIEVSISLDQGRPWDEFTPNTYVLRARLETTAGNKTFKDVREISFGLRELGQTDHHLTINGRKVFLRGNLECCIFPLTGYPPMDVSGWKHVLSITKDYGFNHVRFHSWCPPEAAFVAADEMGFILQIEAPVWDGIGILGRDADRAAWVLEEVDRILDAYGNHPSLCLMSMGNEWGSGDCYYLYYLVEFARDKDSRHYYTATSHPAVSSRNDDYFVAAGNEHYSVRELVPFENDKPSTQNDFRAAVSGFNRPFIVHEAGQFCSYPDYDQINKYTANLKPRNLEVFRKSLDEHHMLDQYKDFQRASGALVMTHYKETIEAILRTPETSLSGFQLLSLQDFPGQGTALVGILDVFWDSKGLITPEQWRQFCSPTVPLLRMRNFVWTNDEPFVGQAEIANYGIGDINQARISWSICYASGEAVADGILPAVDVKTGMTTPLGEIRLDLTTIKSPAHLIVKLWLENTDIYNQWDIWVYPKPGVDPIPEDILVTDEWDDKAKIKLSEGGKVLLLPYMTGLDNIESARWESVFWCTQLFTDQKRTMGIFCDPNHPALAGFPTQYFGNWQWYDLLAHSEGIRLDDTPASYRPVVQFIHDYNHNNKLGCLFEAKVGSGRLLVCSVDLTSNLEKRPEACQFRRSLISYMQSKQFNPCTEFVPDLLNRILKKAVNPKASN